MKILAEMALATKVPRAHITISFAAPGFLQREWGGGNIRGERGKEERRKEVKGVWGKRRIGKRGKKELTCKRGGGVECYIY